MHAFDRTGMIQLLLEGMVTTGRNLQWVSDIEKAGLTPEFPGGDFTQRLHALKERATEAEAGYKELVRGLGSIPIRLEFNPGEEATAEIVELAAFRDGHWHFKYRIGDSTAEHSSTSENLVRAFRASLTPEAEELQPE